MRSLVVRASSGEKEIKLLDDKEGRAEAVLRGLPPGSKVEARLSGGDSLPNDTGHLEIPPPRSIRVFCPGAGPVLDAALGALEGVEKTAAPSSAQVAVFRTKEGTARAGVLPVLLFGRAVGEGGSGKVSPWRTASLHPLVEGLAFSGVRSRALPPGKAGARPLVRNARGMTVAFSLETRRLGGRVRTTPRILVAADPEDRKNGLAESPDFPRFLRRALRALSGLPFVEDGLPAGGWGEVGKGLDGGRVEFRTSGHEPFGIPLREGRAEWPFLGGTDLAFDGVKVPAVSCGGPPVAGDLSLAGEKPGGPAGGGPPPAFWLGLLGLLFLTIEWWAFNRGRAA